MSTHAALLATHVSKSYGATLALDEVDLAIVAGDITTILGPNGAGKTTLTSVFAGLLRPDAGRVLIDGVDVRDGGAVGRVGLAPQEVSVYPILTVRENLAMFASLAGIRSTRGREARVDEIAGSVMLEHLLDRRAGTLSGGERRRLHFALALLGRPRVLLLDEPTVGADVVTRVALLEVVRRLAGEGAAICYTTHHLDEVESLGGEVCILAGGRIVDRGRVEELVSRHGRTAVELVFVDVPTSFDLDHEHRWDGNTLRVECNEPDSVATQLLARLQGVPHRLAAMHIVRPTLETAYLSLTSEPHVAATAGIPSALASTGKRQ